MQINYEAELIKMRKKVKRHKIKQLKVKKPAWMERDAMNRIYTDMNILLKHGEVYWGVLVQANEILFNKEPYLDCPGNVIFSTNPFLNSNPEIMSILSQQIFSYKNTDNASPYLKRVVEIITDERERIFNYPIKLNELDSLKELPIVYAEDDTILFTTMMFFRDYIPGGILNSIIFPVLAAPSLTDISIMLPKKYWTKETLKMFLEN